MFNVLHLWPASSVLTKRRSKAGSIVQLAQKRLAIENLVTGNAFLLTWNHHLRKACFSERIGWL